MVTDHSFMRFCKVTVVLISHQCYFFGNEPCKNATPETAPRYGPAGIRRGHALADSPRHRPEVHPRLCRPRLARTPRPRGIPAPSAAGRARRRRVLGHPSPFLATPHELRRASGRRERTRAGRPRALPQPWTQAARAFLRRRAVLAETPAGADGDRRPPAHAFRRRPGRHRGVRHRRRSGGGRVALARLGVIPRTRHPGSPRRVAAARELRQPRQGLRGSGVTAAPPARGATGRLPQRQGPQAVLRLR